MKGRTRERVQGRRATKGVEGCRRADGGRVQGRVCDNVIMSGSPFREGNADCTACWCAGEEWAGLPGLGQFLERLGSGQRAELHCATLPSVKCQVSDVRLVSGTNKLDTDCWLQADAPDL